MLVYLTVIDFNSKQSELELTDNLITQPPPEVEGGGKKKEKEKKARRRKFIKEMDGRRV